MNTYNGLPLYEAVFDEDGLIIDYIALVKRPANKRTFVAMDAIPAKYSVIDEEERIATGLIMAVDMPIYRRDEIRGEYYVIFTKESVKKMMTDFMREGNGINSILGHNSGAIAEGVFMTESYLKNNDRGISPIGYEDIADGSWFGTYQFDNDEVWQGVKSGTFAGFSIHGMYAIVMPKEKSEEEKLMEELNSISTEIDAILQPN